MIEAACMNAGTGQGQWMEPMYAMRQQRARNLARLQARPRAEKA